MPAKDRYAELQHKETSCLEVLLSSLDARASAAAAGSSMLLYLAELMIRRCKDELAEIREELAACAPAPTRGGASAE